MTQQFQPLLSSLSFETLIQPFLPLQLKTQYSQVELPLSIALSCVGAWLCGASNWPALEGGGAPPPPCLGGPPPPIGLGINIGSANNPINISAMTIPPRMGICLMPVLLFVVDSSTSCFVSPCLSCCSFSFFFLCSWIIIAAASPMNAAGILQL